MDDQQASLGSSIALMRDALAILDEIGEHAAAVHLQFAISLASGEAAPPAGDEQLH